MTNLAPYSASSDGTWIMQGQTRIAPVRELRPTERGDGIYLRTIAAVEPLLAAGGGLLIAKQGCCGERYAAQVLRCEHQHDGLHLLASSLGEVQIEHVPDADDDYLVLHEHEREPAPLAGLLTSEMNCHRGPHVRVDLDRGAWDRWGVRLVESPTADCLCGHSRAESRWRFTPLVEKQRLRIVRLRQRRTMEMILDVAMLRNDRAFGIGHLIATQSWAKP